VILACHRVRLSPKVSFSQGLRFVQDPRKFWHLPSQNIEHELPLVTDCFLQFSCLHAVFRFVLLRFRGYLPNGSAVFLKPRFEFEPMRVLVVEDEPDLLRTISQVLREDGYAVDEAADGQEGLFKAKSWQYDAIVLDLLMPKLTGWQVLEQLRQTHKTPVLILTARDGVTDRVRGLDGGADDYLPKPFHLTELKARLRAIIRRSVGLASSQIMVGELTVDTKTKTVTRGSTLLLLTPREFSLLELLAMHRGHVVTRTQIYEHLFDENEDSLSNLVDVHVSNLRRKLGKDFITTRRGQGYILHD
jgi:two-component system OmpR family response regulator